MPFQLGLCQLEAALNLPSGSDEAEVARAEALAILDRLKATALIDRLGPPTVAAGAPA